MKDITTIQLRKSTRQRLMDLGMKKETYDDIINRLISAYQKATGGRLIERRVP